MFAAPAESKIAIAANQAYFITPSKLVLVATTIL
jgi:hypothetical protein